MKFRVLGKNETLGWVSMDTPGVLVIQPNNPPENYPPGAWWSFAVQMILRRVNFGWGIRSPGDLRRIRNQEWGFYEDDSPVPESLPRKITVELGQPDVILSHQDEANALATLYNALWDAISASGESIPDEEIASAIDELDGSGWHAEKTTTDGREKWQFVRDDSTELAMPGREYRRDERHDQWIPYDGPKHGKGWKNLATGKIVYGVAQPNAEDTDFQQRVEDARKHRQKVRRQQIPPSLSETQQHLAQKTALQPHQLQVANLAWRAIENTHSDLAGRRVQELAHLAGVAYAKLPEERQDIKTRLREIMAILDAMYGKTRGQDIGSQEPGSPQFFPKRSTS